MLSEVKSADEGIYSSILQHILKIINKFSTAGNIFIPKKYLRW